MKQEDVFFHLVHTFRRDHTCK